jgi:hypothetical protein
MALSFSRLFAWLHRVLKRRPKPEPNTIDYSKMVETYWRVYRQSLGSLRPSLPSPAEKSRDPSTSSSDLRSITKPDVKSESSGIRGTTPSLLVLGEGCTVIHRDDQVTYVSEAQSTFIVKPLGGPSWLITRLVELTTRHVRWNCDKCGSSGSAPTGSRVLPPYSPSARLRLVVGGLTSGMLDMCCPGCSAFAVAYSDSPEDPRDGRMSDSPATMKFAGSATQRRSARVGVIPEKGRRGRKRKKQSPRSR